MPPPRGPSKGPSRATKERRFRRELEAHNRTQLRAEHHARLQLQVELEHQAKLDRARDLARARDKLEGERAKTSARGARRRGRIRSRARIAIGGARQARKVERKWWRDFQSLEKRQTRRKVKRKQSKGEIDSLTEHNIDPELVPFFRKLRRQFPYNRTPDERAELFGEYLHDNPDELAQWQLEQAAAQDWAASELEHYGAELGDELSAVPF